MRKTTSILCVAILVMVVGGSVYAEPGHRGMGRGRSAGSGFGPGMMTGNPLLTAPWVRIVEATGETDITEDQLSALSELRKKYRETTGSLRTSIHNRRAELRELMVNAEFSERAKAMELVDEISNLQGQALKNNISASFEIKKLFSEEQLQQLRQISESRREDMRENRRSGRGRRGHGRGRY